MEVEERVDERIHGFESTLNEMASKVLLGVCAGAAVLFGLFALAYGLGTLFGHEAWGFLAVSLVLTFATAVFRLIRPELVKLPRLRAGDSPARRPGKSLVRPNGKAPQLQAPPGPFP